MSAPLQRRLGLADAVTIGLAAMLGAGVFAVWAPAASAAGVWLLAGLTAAGVIAACNATSSAQLAAQYPAAGGAYVYGRERLGAWPGFLAGWSFTIGKTASGAAMALTFAAYLVPAAWQRPVAIVAVLAITGVNLLGISRTATLGRVLVAATLVVLGIVIVAGFVAESGAGWAGAGFASGGGLDVGGGASDAGWYGVLQSAGLLFFAFAGYARIATLGEEVRAPARTIPRAVVIALSIVFVLYLLVALAVLSAVPVGELAASAAPLRDVVDSVGWRWAVPVIGIGAALACLGSLLALVAGVSRTVLAMARERDLPHPLAGVARGVPWRAELVVAVAACCVVLVGDIRAVIGFSSFGVLLYYLVANLAALTQDAGNRRYPRALAVLGSLGCVVLVVTLPVSSVLGGVVVLAAGVVYRGIRTRGIRNRAGGMP